MRLAIFILCLALCTGSQPAAASHAITLEDLLMLVEASVSEEVILLIVEVNGVTPLSADDLWRVRGAGASDALIQALEETAGPSGEGVSAELVSSTSRGQERPVATRVISGSQAFVAPGPSFLPTLVSPPLHGLRGFGFDPFFLDPFFAPHFFGLSLFQHPFVHHRFDPFFFHGVRHHAFLGHGALGPLFFGVGNVHRPFGHHPLRFDPFFGPLSVGHQGVFSGGVFDPHTSFVQQPRHVISSPSGPHHRLASPSSHLSRGLHHSSLSPSASGTSRHRTAPKEIHRPGPTPREGLASTPRVHSGSFRPVLRDSTNVSRTGGTHSRLERRHSISRPGQLRQVSAGQAWPAKRLARGRVRTRLIPSASHPVSLGELAKRSPLVAARPVHVERRFLLGTGGTRPSRGEGVPHDVRSARGLRARFVQTNPPLAPRQGVGAHRASGPTHRVLFRSLQGRPFPRPSIQQRSSGALSQHTGASLARGGHAGSHRSLGRSSHHSSGAKGHGRTSHGNHRGHRGGGSHGGGSHG